MPNNFYQCYFWLLSEKTFNKVFNSVITWKREKPIKPYSLGLEKWKGTKVAAFRGKFRKELWQNSNKNSLIIPIWKQGFPVYGQENWIRSMIEKSGSTNNSGKRNTHLTKRKIVLKAY